MKRIFNAFCSAALFASLLVRGEVALAETGPLGWGEAELTQSMETDRPDFTEGTQTVQSGHAQLEVGYTYIYDDEDSVKVESHSVPETLLRIGLMTDLELRLAWGGYAFEETQIDTPAGRQESDIDGATDISVGFKHFMYDQDGWLPNLSLILELGLPVGSDEFTADDVESAGKILWAYDVNDETGVAGNLNLASVEGEVERYIEVSSSLALAHSITDEVGVYVEYYGFYPAESIEPETTENYVNGGFTYGVTENLQLDIRAGFGINKAADDFFTGVGVSFRS